jgi:hypothetical protein
MTRELFVGAAVLLILAPAAFAQPAASAAGSADPSVSAQINATLEAGRIAPSGQIPPLGSDAATVGAAATGQGLRMPNPSTGTYNGLPARTYGAPGATPYTGPASLPSGSAGRAYPPATTPYTGPGALPGPTASGPGG